MSQSNSQYIPYGKQHICQSDIDAVVDVLNSDFLTQGPQVPLFEKKVSEFVGVKYACAMNSATSALHVACLALDVGPGDIVWTSPISFVASSNCALYCGATVDFVDIDEITGLISTSALVNKLKTAEKAKRLPKVLIPVHIAGHSCDMQKISTLCAQYGIRVIEDASHAIGGKYQDTLIGDCRYSDITIFSFHPVKIITSAEGGMALTNDPDIHQALKLYHSHGITRENLHSDVNQQPWYYEQQVLGFNYRMSELHAALGVNQLNKINAFVETRNQLAQYYLDALQVDSLLSENVSPLIPSPDCYSAYHLFVIRLADPKKRQTVFEALRAEQIGVNVHYIPICNQPYYIQLGFQPEDYPAAQRYYQSAITLPLHPSLSHEEQDRILSIVKESL
ncbi:UDP-4-amino-4,6-dideoxy-N-acetyl-beta-L-altrosamine transaminase [Colwellia sp. MEBiC06753]